MSQKSVASPARGEIWGVDLDPTVGPEQTGFRPALVVSADAMNQSHRGLVIVAPITGTPRGFPSHVSVTPPDGGLSKPIEIMTEQIRAVSKERLGRRYGAVSQATMSRVDEILRMILAI